MNGVERLVRPMKGVRQGDPLSPLLCNLVLDEFISSLPPQVGPQIGVEASGTRIGALAFADDIVLLAETPKGLQLSLDNFPLFAGARGLHINAANCATWTLRPSGRQKLIKVTNTKYHVGEECLPCLSVLDKLRYLGVLFDCFGKVFPCIDDISQQLEALRLSPLKPHQKLVLLLFYIPPRVIYAWTVADLKPPC